MDEEKKKYLEELRKQIDPDVLAKMANYLGTGDVASTDSAVGASMPISTGDSTADLIRDRRASEFQEKVARRKRESQPDVVPQENTNKFADWTVLVFSSTDIWSRIVESQFKMLGFNNSDIFSDFDDLIRHIIDLLKNESTKQIVVAVAMKEIRTFLISWDKIRKNLKEKEKHHFIDDVIYFLVAESPKQVQEQLFNIIGEDRIICLTDDLPLNKEKVEKVVSLINQSK